MSSQIATNVCLVIVTHNRKDLLIDALESVLGGSLVPARIYLIDNASTDGTESVLRSAGMLDNEAIRFVRLSKNVGGAGGFSHGIRLAFHEGAEWIWVMDDDCAPRSDALQKLIAGAETLHTHGVSSIGFLASRVIWTDGSPCLMNIPNIHREWMESHAFSFSISRIVSSSFVSMLISREAVSRTGLPIKEFFIWFDDAEYSYRISRALRSYFVSDSVVVHQTKSNDLPLDFSKIDRGSSWKYRLGVRNETSFRLANFGASAAVLFCAMTLARVARSPNGRRFFMAILLSCLQGIFFRHTRFIERA